MAKILKQILQLKLSIYIFIYQYFHLEQEEDPLNKLLQQYGSSVAEQFTSSVWPGYMFTGNLRPAYPLVILNNFS